MKITDIKTFIVGNPWKNWLFVKVYTDEDITGLGEATQGLATKPGLGDLEELRRHVGTQFDPVVVDAFLAAFPDPALLPIASSS